MDNGTRTRRSRKSDEAEKVSAAGAGDENETTAVSRGRSSSRRRRSTPGESDSGVSGPKTAELTSTNGSVQPPPQPQHNAQSEGTAVDQKDKKSSSDKPGRHKTRSKSPRNSDEARKSDHTRSRVSLQKVPPISSRYTLQSREKLHCTLAYLGGSI